MDTKVQENKRRAAISRIVRALQDGRHLSLFDGAEFAVAEMHTCFCVVRQKIRDGKITGYVMKDCWRVNANRIRYKEYWFEDENNEN